MSNRVRFLVLIIAVCGAFQHGAANAALRKEVCASIPFPDGGDCFTGHTCTVGVRGDWLDLTDSVTVRDSPPNATVTIESKGVDNSGGNCVPTANGREGFVKLRLTNITDMARASGVMKIRLSRPALGGRDHTDIQFDVRPGSPYVKRDTFTARRGEQKNFDLVGKGLVHLEVLQPGNNTTGDDRVVSVTQDGARVRLTFNTEGAISMETKLRFDNGEPPLNATNGWPTVTVGAPPRPPTPPGITITMGGNNGGGTVVSTPQGINCTSGTCRSEFLPNTTVILTATANATSRFIGWTGNCPATPTVCSINNSTVPAATATARFDRVTRLTVNKTGAGGAGGGTVTGSTHISASGPINCGTQCASTTVDYTNSNASVTLTAVQAAGRTFAGWTVLNGSFQGGTCGTNLTCTLTTIGTTNRVVEARFN